MPKLRALAPMAGAFAMEDGSVKHRLQAGEVFVADEDNAARLLRRRAAEPAPAPKTKSKGKPKKTG